MAAPVKMVTISCWVWVWFIHLAVPTSAPAGNIIYPDLK